MIAKLAPFPDRPANIPRASRHGSKPLPKSRRGRCEQHKGARYGDQAPLHLQSSVLKDVSEFWGSLGR